MTKEKLEITKGFGTTCRVIVIGGCNIDLQGISSQGIKLQDSNPGKLLTSAGGVGRNIASNIARLGLSTCLLTALARDEDGEYLRLSTLEDGVDMTDILYSKDYPTSVYLSVLDEKGELVVAINQMDILSQLNTDYLKEKKDRIDGSSLIVIDANLEEEAIEYLCKNHGNKLIFADPVSAIKSRKLKNFLQYFYAIKPNLLEMETLVGRKLRDMRDYKKAIGELLELGVKQVYLTLGKEGVLVADSKRIIHATGEVSHLQSVTGAGDAFLAAAVYSTFKGWDIERLAGFSQAMALISLESKNNTSFTKEEKIVKRRKAVKTQSLAEV
ncbi:MAG: kinase [Tissierellia bacterium]|nr:kinase [Tissierellia bacterium]